MKNICIVGLSNSGKTSLVTTLRHEDSGQVADRANVTLEPSHFAFPEMDVNLIDFPGFLRPGAAKILLERGAEVDSLKTDFSAEWFVLNAAQECSCYILLLDSCGVPDGNTEDSVNLLRMTGKPILALINKSGLHRGNAEHVKLFKSFCDENAIPSMCWDIFYDSYLKIPIFFRKVAEIICDEKMILKAEGLKTAFSNRTEKISSLIVDAYNELSCKSERFVSDSKEEKNSAKLRMDEFKEEFFLKVVKKIFTELNQNRICSNLFSNAKTEESVLRTVYAARDQFKKNVVEGAAGGAVLGGSVGLFESGLAALQAGALLSGGLVLAVVGIFAAAGAVVCAVQAGRDRCEDVNIVELKFDQDSKNLFLSFIISTTVLASRFGFLGGVNTKLEKSLNERITEIYDDVNRRVEKIENVCQKQICDLLKEFGL